REAWRKFVTETGNAEPWGPVFKWLKVGGVRPSECLPAAIRKTDGTFTKSLRETGEKLMDTLVPEDSQDGESPQQIEARAETGIAVGSLTLTSENLENIPLCEIEEVKRAIWRMAPNKSPGLDGITAKILRQAWPVIAEDITHVFNNCLRAKKFPSIWKKAGLVVIKKSPEKDPSEAKSYRPISLLPVISKALEHVIVDRIRQETDANMSRRQFGFTKNLSTIDAIHHATDWAKTRHVKYVHAIFLDISGAFDCLWWPQLVQDMSFAGCSSELIELTKSYLDGRQSEMTIGDQ
ncbi:reverse transcriptase, partial [Thalictrum thalictroides]